PGARAELEAEERPALWALAGEWEAALAEAAGLASPIGSLWLEILSGGLPATGAWEALRELEPYRAARLVWDAEKLVPHVVPPPWLRAAIVVFRELGAGLFAELLEARMEGLWWALGAYVARPPGDPDAVALLLAAAGTEEALVALGPRCSPACSSALLGLVARDTSTAMAQEGRGERPSSRPRPGSALVGESPAFRAVLTRLALMARSDLAVLILGETGTGKELAAHEIHARSARARFPFVAVNCSTLAESLAGADLFGHLRGSFTGADRDRTGIFESAHRGTLLLDEVGDLPSGAQALLLRVLQEGELRRVGESLPRRVDIRVLSATHRDLARMVAAGTFREDLYHRLTGGVIELPPLRERGSDLLLLAEHLLARWTDPRAVLSRGACARLLEHDWPGNVRELENVLRLAAALSGGGTIAPEHIELPAAARSGTTPSGSYHQQVDALRRRLVSEALRSVNGKYAAAAHRLGISRQALSYLVRQLGLR
ncbi:MAG: sigma 54-interacting transcriptional regulator, partial [Acidobacteriota bacterium]|nr:sigma 54-interacting transcriptional regulator [Acidobacteriota bacterium]